MKSFPTAMKFAATVAVIQLVVCVSLARKCVPLDEVRPSNIGREFIFGILDNLNYAYHRVTAVSIDVVPETAGNVTVEIPFLHINMTYAVTPKAIFSIPVNYTIQRDGTFTDQRAIRVSSTMDITILVNNNYFDNWAYSSYVIFPTTVAGKRHIVSSYEPFYPPYGSRLMVTGLSDNTLVTIDNGNATVITLNRLDVYQMQAHGTDDLTGDIVTSDKPVVVVSGTGYAGIPSHLAYVHDHIASQMLPTDTWTNAYIVPPVKPMTSFMVRILSEYQDVNVTFTNSTNTFTVTPQSSTDFFFATDPVIITADSPIGVVQYGAVSHGYDAANNPFMTMVPGPSQYAKQYAFSVPRPADRFTYQLQVIVPSEQTSGLLLDDATIQGGVTSSLSVAPPFNRFTVLTVNVTKGYHRMSHQNKDVQFGLLVMGLRPFYNKPGVQYGYYAGVNLNGSCVGGTTSLSSVVTTLSSGSPKVTTVITSSITSTSKGTSQTITTIILSSQTTTEQTTTVALKKAPMCFACVGVNQLELCKDLQQCSTSQVCFVERNFTSTGIKFSSGCMETNQCSKSESLTANSADTCVECCHGDYCNNKGCGDTGFPSRDQRGQLCFDCQNVANTSECHRVSMCAANQRCRTEVAMLATSYSFNLGCADQSCSPVSSPAGYIPVCLSCCDVDFCNLNCTRTGSGLPDIVG